VSGAPPVPLDEARRRLRDLGYLDGRVDRFLFRRAFEGRGGLFLPAVALSAFAAALASTAAVESTEAGFGASLGAVAVLFAHLFLADLLPAALAAVLVAMLADRARSPGALAVAAGLGAAGAVVVLWVGGVWSLARDLPARALVWGVPIAAAAFLSAIAVRGGVLARAYAHSHVLPSRRRSRFALASAALLVLAGALALLGVRGEILPAPAPRPSPRSGAVVVVAVDGFSDGTEAEAGRDLAELFAGAATGWWPAAAATPPEIWTNLATGERPERHGVRALERVRPLFSPLAVRAPFGTSWYLRRLGPALRLVRGAPVSSGDRRRPAFWEVAASAGLPSQAVGWWASGAWPGAEVVSNEELLSGARDGLDADRRARAFFRRAVGGERIRTVYLPGLDILRAQPERRRQALGETALFLEEEAAAARSHGDVLVVLAASSHPASAALGRMLVFDAPSASARTVRIREVDVAPSILARAGIPAARDLPGRPADALFAPGSLDPETVPTYGDRVAPRETRRGTDREYLEKLRSLGYLN
jgi:hypothetical protein